MSDTGREERGRCKLVFDLCLSLSHTLYCVKREQPLELSPPARPRPPFSFYSHLSVTIFRNLRAVEARLSLGLGPGLG